MKITTQQAQAINLALAAAEELAAFVPTSRASHELTERINCARAILSQAVLRELEKPAFEQDGHHPQTPRT